MVRDQDVTAKRLRAAATAIAIATSATLIQPHFEAFVPVLKVQELPTQLWEMGDVLRFYSVVAGRWLEVPKGFRTDGCSIPRIPGVYLLAGGKAQEAGYLHDWLYTSQMFARAVCDEILREAVIAMGYSEALAEAMYLAVREFGASHWDLPNVPQLPAVAAMMQAP